MPMGNFDSTFESPAAVDNLHNGLYYKCTGTVSLALAALLFLDLFFDFMSSMLAQAKQQRIKEKKKKDNHVDIINNKEMLMFIASIVILPISSFIPYGAVKDIALFTECCGHAHIMLLPGAVLASLNRFDNKYFPTWITLSTLIVIILGNILWPYHLDNTPANNVIVTAVLGVACLAAFFMCCYYVFDTVLFTLCGFKRWKIPCYDYCFRCFASTSESGDVQGDKRQAVATTTQPHTHVYTFFRCIYCTMIFMYLLIRIVLETRLPLLAGLYADDIGMFLVNIPATLFAAGLVMFNLRLVKHEAVEVLVDLLDAKKSYVRYISHGMCSFSIIEYIHYYL